MTSSVLWLNEIGLDDIDRVGGKNASLGELMTNLSSIGVRVPEGFATTADAFRGFLRDAGLDTLIATTLEGLDADDVVALAKAGAAIRAAIVAADFSPEFEQDVRQHYVELVAGNVVGEGAASRGSHDLLAAPSPRERITWAVRSSATAEDLPDASFAGQQETFLNITGVDNILDAIKQVFASLYNDRAIAYRVHHAFDHYDIALSAGVQRMVRSDLGSSGVMFTIDTESGFEDAVFVTSAYGLGEGVVQGAVNPDEFYVYKPALAAGRPAILKRGLGQKATKMVFTGDRTVGRTTEFVPVAQRDRSMFSLSDAEVQTLASLAVSVEQHYGRPMDIEWGKDGIDGKIYLLQARPETVTSRRPVGAVERYALTEFGTVAVEGRAIGQKIGSGPVRILSSLDEMHRFAPGDVLVTDMTDPDWEPIMKRASAIVTNRGGRTCHAAIIARELGIPAVVGTGDATTELHEGDEVTVSCAEGETGYVYHGLLSFAVSETSLESMPESPVKIMMNVGTPDQAFNFAQIPNQGVGLARLEFIINRQIGIHPKALLELERARHTGKPAELGPRLVAQIDERIAAYASPRDYFVKRVAEGVSMIAAAFAPKPVVVRMSDFKSNEYANLIAGSLYEPHEENPMIGYRGASRYISESFRECFELECEAIRLVRDTMGLSNVKLMIPFVRTVDEAERVIDLLAQNGLRRGTNGLEVYMMCELPSNAVLANRFLDHFDGFSIGSNDMTQLTLGLDRDSSLVAESFDERDEAVKAMLRMAISACRQRGKYVGICGQGPSDHADFAEWLVRQGIESMSLNPDTVVNTWVRLSSIGASTTHDEESTRV